MKMKSKGMTLIEVIISIAILAIVLIPIANVGISAIKTNKRADMKQKAGEVGQKVLEQVGMYDTMTETKTGGVKEIKLEIGKGLILTETTDPSNGQKIYKGSLEDSATGNDFTVNVALKKNSDQSSAKWLNVAKELNKYYNIIYIGETDDKSSYCFSWVRPGEGGEPKYFTTKCTDTIANFLKNDTGAYNCYYKFYINQNLEIELKKVFPDRDQTIDMIQPLNIVSYAQKEIALDAAYDTTKDKKFLFILGENFTSGTTDSLINISIESNFDGEIEFDVMKESNKTTGKYNFNILQSKKPVTVRAVNQLTYQTKDIGSLYDISVSVHEKTSDGGGASLDGEGLFDGSISKNILVN